MAEAGTAHDREPVDIVLVDCDLGAEKGSMIVQSVMETGLGKRILLLAAGMSDIDTVRMLKFGISGIVTKHSPSAELVNAIRKAVRGEIWLDSKAVRVLVAGAVAGATGTLPPPGSLNSRARRVVRAL